MGPGADAALCELVVDTEEAILKPGVFDGDPEIPEANLQQLLIRQCGPGEFPTGHGASKPATRSLLRWCHGRPFSTTGAGVGMPDTGLRWMVALGFEPPITSIRTGRAARCSVRHLSAAFCSSSSVQQSGLRETVREPLGILLPLEGQPTQMFVERVFRIDLHELAPNAAGLVHLVEMTESGRQRGS